MLSKRRRELPTDSFSLLHGYLTLADVNMRYNSKQAFEDYKGAIAQFAYIPDCYLARARAFIAITERNCKTTSPSANKQVIDVAFISGYKAALHNCYQAIELTPQNLTAHKLRAKILMTIQKPAYASIIADLMAQELVTLNQDKLHLQVLEEINQNMLADSVEDEIQKELDHASEKYKLDLQVYNAITNKNLTDTFSFIKQLGNEIQKFGKWHQRILFDIHSQSINTKKTKILIISSAANTQQIQAELGYSDEIAENVMLAVEAYKKDELGIASYYFEIAHQKFPTDVLSITYKLDIALRIQMHKKQSLATPHNDIIKVTEKHNFCMLHALNAYAYAQLKNYKKSAASYIKALGQYTSEHLEYFNSMQAEIFASLKDAGKLTFSLSDSSEPLIATPKSTQLAQRYENVAEQCFDDGNLQDALLYYSLAIWHEDEKRVEQSDKLARLYRMRSHLSLLDKNINEANKNLDYSKQYSTSPHQFYSLTAIDEIERLVSKTQAKKDSVPDHITPYFNEYLANIRAFELFNETKYKHICLEILNYLIDCFPHLPDAYFYRAKLFKALSCYEEARMDLAVALRMSPYNIDLLNLNIEIGRALNEDIKYKKLAQAQATEKFNEFNKIFRRSISLYKAQLPNPELTSAQTFLGEDAFQRKHSALANYHFTKSLLKDKENFIAQTYRGFTSFFDQSYEAALEDFNYCIGVFDYDRAYYGRALLHLRDRNYKAAAADFLRAYAKRMDEDFEFYNNIFPPEGVIYARQDAKNEELISETLVNFMEIGAKELDANSPKTAKFHFNIALMIDNPEFLHTYYLLRCLTNITLGLPDEAVADIKNAIKIATHKKIPNEEITILLSTFSQKCYEVITSTLYKPSSVLAMQLCHIGLSIYPTQQLHLQRARLLVRSGNYIEAKNDLMQGIKLAEDNNIDIDPNLSALFTEIDFQIDKIHDTKRVDDYTVDLDPTPSTLVTEVGFQIHNKPDTKPTAEDNINIDHNLSTVVPQINIKINKPKKPSNQFNNKKTKKKNTNIVKKVEEVKSEDNIAELKAAAKIEIDQPQTVPTPNTTTTIIAEIETTQPKLSTATSASNKSRNNRQRRRKERLRANYKSNLRHKDNLDESDNEAKDSKTIIATDHQTSKGATKISISTQVGHKSLVTPTVSPKSISYADILKRTISPVLEESEKVVTDQTIVAHATNTDTIASTVEETIPAGSIASATIEGVVADHPFAAIEAPLETNVESVAPQPNVFVTASIELEKITTADQEVQAITLVEDAQSNVVNEPLVASVGTQTFSVSLHSQLEASATFNLSVMDVPHPTRLESGNSAIATTTGESDQASSPRSMLHGSETSEGDTERSSPAQSPTTLDSVACSSEPSPFLTAAGSLRRTGSTTLLPILQELIEPARAHSTPLIEDVQPTSFDFRHQQSSPSPLRSAFFHQPELPLRSIKVGTLIPDHIPLYEIEHRFFQCVSNYERMINQNISEPQDHVQFKTFINGGSVYDRILHSYKQGLLEIFPRLHPRMKKDVTNYLNKRMFNRDLTPKDIDIITELPRDIVLQIAEYLGLKFIVPTWATNNTQNIAGTYSPNIDCLSFTYGEGESEIKIDIVCKPKIIFNHEANLRTSRFFLDAYGRKIDLSGVEVHDLTHGQMRITCGPTSEYLIEPLKLLHFFGQTSKRKLRIFESEILKTRPYDPLPIAHSWISSGLQKLFSKGNVVNHYYQLHEYNFFQADSVLGPIINNYLVNDQRWIEQQLAAADQLTYPSLRHIYCILIASMALQFVLLKEHQKIAQIHKISMLTQEPVEFDALQSYNEAFSDERLIVVCDSIIKSNPLFKVYLGDGISSKPYVPILSSYIRKRKASELGVPLITTHQDIWPAPQTLVEEVEDQQSHYKRRR